MLSQSMKRRIISSEHILELTALVIILDTKRLFSSVSASFHTRKLLRTKSRYSSDSSLSLMSSPSCSNLLAITFSVVFKFSSFLWCSSSHLVCNEFNLILPSSLLKFATAPKKPPIQGMLPSAARANCSANLFLFDGFKLSISFLILIISKFSSSI